MTYTLGLDVGTQGTKALLLDAESGVVLGRSSVSYDLIPGLAGGVAEQDPLTWRRALREAIALLKLNSGADLGLVTSVGVSGQQHGAVLLDKHYAPIRAAKLWCDTSTAPEAAELSQALGRAVPTGYSASKWLWVARHEPENWARCAHLLLPHDYINHLLCGELAMEAGDASGTGLFDVQKRRFDGEALAKFDALCPADSAGVSSRLPELRGIGSPEEVLGRVHCAAAEEFGLPVGAVVSLGGGDNMMSAIGSGATRPGVVTLSLGTSGTVFTHADEPILDPEGLVAPFCGSAGGWLPLLCVMNMTGVAEEVCSAFGRTHADLTASAQGLTPGCEGLLWLPYLQGERVPDLPLASGRLLGMRPGHLRAECLYRAALEGTSLNLAWGFERMRAQGIAADELRLVGGAASNPLWCEILAACFQVPVQPLVEQESAALGAALQALWCWRSERGEGSALAELGSSCIRMQQPPTQPRSEWIEPYARLLERFKLEASRL